MKNASIESAGVVTHASEAKSESGATAILGEGALKRGRDGFIEVGPERYIDISLPDLIVFPQVRKKMELAGVEELAQALLIPVEHESGSEEARQYEICMQNPPQVAILDRDELEAYKQGLAKFWEIDAEDLLAPEDLPTCTIDGIEKYAVLIAGHRRHTALLKIAEEHDEDPANFKVAVSPNYRIDFDRGLTLQIRENVYTKPSPYEEALAIRAWFNLFLRDNDLEPTVAHMSRALGYSETKISDALSFVEVADSIQSLVRNKVLPYKVGSFLSKIQRAYLEKYRIQEEQGRLAIKEVNGYELVELPSDGKRNRFRYDQVPQKLETPEDYALYDLTTFTLDLMTRRLRNGKASNAVFDHMNRTLKELKAGNETLRNQTSFEMTLATAEASNYSADREYAARNLALMSAQGLILALQNRPSALEPLMHDKLATHMMAVPSSADVAADGVLLALQEGRLSPETRSKLLGALSVEEALVYADSTASITAKI